MSTSDRMIVELLGIFATEAEEHIESINRGLLELEAAEDTAAVGVLEEMFRAAHSLKGAARAVNLPPVESVAHQLESLFADLQQAAAPADEVIAEAYRLVDAIQNLVRTAVPGEPTGEEPVRSEEDGVRPHEPGPAAPAQATEETVRVATRKLDALIAQVGELVVSRLGAEQRLAEVRGLEATLAQWEAAWRKVADPGETLAKEDPAGEGLARLRGARRTLGRFRAALDADVRRLAQVTADLEGDVRRARLLPLAKILDAFPRMVRDLAKDRGKEVRLVVRGAETEVDRSLLEHVKDPLVHLVRNCVDHGIEPPREREGADKPRTGTVSISAQRHGETLLLEVGDDGAGIDVDGVRRRAVDRGVLSGAGATDLPEEEAVSLIFRHGISTADAVSEVSGRGVGLDAVRDAVERLHGSASVRTGAGTGTTFSLSLPVSVSTMECVLLEMGRQTFALPVAAVERIVRVGDDDVVRAQGRSTVLVGDAPVALVPLAEVLGVPAAAAAPTRSSAVVVASHDRRVAFLADRVTRAVEVVTKRLPEPLFRVRLVAGATILGSGEVAVILSPGDLVSSVERHQGGRPMEAEAGERRAATVLVVEDSVTTRTLEKNILEAAGYAVLTAGDGLEAWSILESSGCDLIVADVEMPRMDGFTLTARVRSDRRFGDTPVVLVTSRSSREDRERGVEAGADAYIVKGAFDQERLLDTIGRLL